MEFDAWSDCRTANLQVAPATANVCVSRPETGRNTNVKLTNDILKSQKIEKESKFTEWLNTIAKYSVHVYKLSIIGDNVHVLGHVEYMYIHWYTYRKRTDQWNVYWI